MPFINLLTWLLFFSLSESLTQLLTCLFITSTFELKVHVWPIFEGRKRYWWCWSLRRRCVYEKCTRRASVWHGRLEKPLLEIPKWWLAGVRLHGPAGPSESAHKLSRPAHQGWARRRQGPPRCPPLEAQAAGVRSLRASWSWAPCYLSDDLREVVWQPGSEGAASWDLPLKPGPPCEHLSLSLRGRHSDPWDLKQVKWGVMMSFCLWGFLTC